MPGGHRPERGFCWNWRFDRRILGKEEGDLLLEETGSCRGYETADDGRVDGEDEDGDRSE